MRSEICKMASNHLNYSKNRSPPLKNAKNDMSGNKRDKDRKDISEPLKPSNLFLKVKTLNKTKTKASSSPTGNKTLTNTIVLDPTNTVSIFNNRNSKPEPKPANTVNRKGEPIKYRVFEKSADNTKALKTKYKNNDNNNDNENQTFSVSAKLEHNKEIIGMPTSNPLNSSNKNVGLKFEKKKKVMGYNYFTNRQKELETDDQNLIKNIPVSIFAGTWNCEYFDFSKDHFEKKRHVTDNVEYDKNEQNVTRTRERHAMRSITPILYYDPVKRVDGKQLIKDDEDAYNSDDNNTAPAKKKGLNKLVHSKSFIKSKFIKHTTESETTLECNSSTYQNMNITVFNSNDKGKHLNEENKDRSNVNISQDSFLINYNENELSRSAMTQNDIKKMKRKISKKEMKQLDYMLCKELSMNENHEQREKQAKEEMENKFGETNSSINKKKTVKNDTYMNHDINAQMKKNIVYVSKNKDKAPFSCWVPPYHDVYVVSLQESISDSIIDSLSEHLKEVNQEPYVYLPLADYKLSGYGDGAFLQTKSTTIAAWVRKTKLYPNGPIKLCASKSIAFNKLNNSKGCVSILFNIFNQFVLFIGCHMPAKDQEMRQKSREFILTKLSEYFSNRKTSNFKDVFHHVIWMGDFNFRVKGIEMENVVRCLKSNNIEELLKYDEINNSCQCDFLISFKELPINFLPTYKKVEGRPVINKKDSDWVEKEYKLIHNIKWYKGGKQEPRIPSWTDRIFKWSNDKTKNCLNFVPNSYISAVPQEKSILLASDHSPVACCFYMYRMKYDKDIPPTKNIWKF